MSELSRELLREQAGHQSFDRGLGYLDQISGLRIDQGIVRATVSGRRRYRVHVTAEGTFSWYCSCPWAEEGNCCKHVVAVCLVYLYEREHDSGNTPTVPDITAYLHTLDHGQLVELLLEETEESSALTFRLEVLAALAAGELDALHSLFESALHITGPVPFDQAFEYARAVHSAVDAVHVLEESGRTEAAVELYNAVCEFTYEAEEMVEDLDGEVLGALEDLHL